MSTGDRSVNFWGKKRFPPSFVILATVLGHLATGLLLNTFNIDTDTTGILLWWFFFFLLSEVGRK